MNVRSLWRTLLYKNLAKVSLSGAVIDLGGSRKSAYVKNFKGEFKLTVANLDEDETRDILLNLEEPFAIPNAQYDHVLCINVLEHIFHYQNVITETRRILKPGGQAIFAVPFLIQIHPSPHDHWRFTKETLQRLFVEAGYSDVEVEAIGTGVFGASAQLKFNIVQIPLLRWLMNKGGEVLDRLVTTGNQGKNYTKEFYPLGYVIRAYRKD